MKKLLLTTLFCLLLISTSFAYTYDGEFDPGVFAAWDKTDRSMCIHGHYHYTAINPDKNSDVRVVEVLGIPFEGMYYVGAYRYFKGTEEYIFVGDFSRLHYERINLEGGDKSTVIL